mgnify:CR=1 FL=1
MGKFFFDLDKDIHWIGFVEVQLARFAALPAFEIALLFAAYSFGNVFEVESYLEHHANKFTGQFDPNCYLYLSRASDLFDVADHGGTVMAGLKRIEANRTPLPTDTPRRGVLWRRLILDRDIDDFDAWAHRTPDAHSQ